MIADVLLIILGSFITVLFTVMGLVTWVVPDSVNDSFVYLGTFVGKLQPLFPVDTASLVAVTLLSFIGFYYGYKLIIKAWGWIRGASYNK